MTNNSIINIDNLVNQTELRVNLDALDHNFHLYKSMLRPTTGIVCMVKAAGYGAGSVELARDLQDQGAAYLAVANLDEGVQLRKGGITMPIMVLNPGFDIDYNAMFANRLEPEVYNFFILNRITKAARQRGITAYPVHIKIDSGMHRLGFLEQNIDDLVNTLKATDTVVPASIFSHLATADCLDQDEYTLGQLEYFDRVSSTFIDAFPHKILRHILNSTGITRFNEYQYDLVRLGICLYGIPTVPDGSQSGLHPVSSLHTRVISIKEWDEGTTIGYSRRGVLHRHSRIATIPIGYADGYNRLLGNGKADVWIADHRCPTLGNICMDACMIDVTDAPDCHVGSEVEIFGPHISVEELADKLGTITYEVLTGVSSRVKRVYYRENPI
ncbi:MAG: alanine racemase [Muribaculaceae bacterium]|nr:alanine racemase [Muribaculaceae bacterium]